MAGGIAGFIWGGLGGRVAMRILFLTSDDRVKGLTSDDGFEIGVITAATIFLLTFASILGTLAGAVFGLLRIVLGGPGWLVTLGVGITAAAVGGGLLVQADGIDFRVLEPLWLAVALFVLIPGLWGISVEPLTRRLVHVRAIFRTPPSYIERHYWGAAGTALGWLTMAALTTLGLIKLADDLSRLT